MRRILTPPLKQADLGSEFRVYAAKRDNYSEPPEGGTPNGGSVKMCPASNNFPKFLLTDCVKGVGFRFVRGTIATSSASQNVP
jgi:hypothetical protein